MQKIALILFLFILSGIVLPAKGQQKASIDELNALLKKSQADTTRIKLLLEAGLIYVLRPGSLDKDMDSALFFTNTAMALSQSLQEPVWEAGSYTVYSKLYREKGEVKKGREYIQKAIPVFEKYGRKSLLADAYIELGNYYNAFSNSEVTDKIRYFKKAEELYAQTGEKLKQAFTLKDIGDFYQLWEKDSLSLEALHKSLAIYQSVNHKEVQGVYDLIGYVLYHMGDYRQALKYSQLAVRTAEQLKVTGQELSTIYNRMGLTYYQLLQYAEAADYFKKSFSIAMSAHDTGSALIISPNIINSLLRLEKAQELLSYLQSVKSIYATAGTEYKITYAASYILAYLLANRYKDAEPHARQLLSMMEGKSHLGLRRTFYRAIIPYYLFSGRYQEMYKYLPENEKICKESNLMSGLMDNYLWWFKADSALGNPTGALARYKQYKEASDSALRIANNKQITQLLIEYETSKKDQAIALKEKDIQLLTSQAELREAQLKQSGLMRNLALGGVVLSLFIIGLLYNRYRLKQQSNKQLQLQQQEINEKNYSLQRLLDQKEKLLDEKEWLVKEIHHRVKNNMQIVMSLLNTQSAYLEDEALTAIQDSQHRMQAMSLIHQKLYQAENVAFINMYAYIHELTAYLRESYDSSHHVRFELTVEAIELDVAQAMPVGLILNEAITNAIKYAFPGNGKGIVTIRMQCLPDHHILLAVSDNGIGLPAGFSSNNHHSLGMNMMQGLVSQLDGTLLIESGTGLKITIRFPYKKIVASVLENESFFQVTEA